VIPAGSAAASVWSSTGLCLPLALEQEAQFFQKPIVRESPPGGDLRIEIEVEDVLGELANVTVRSVVYTEYLHLARTSDGWKIVNDLWQQTPSSAP
jgi:hypothetical protein